MQLDASAATRRRATALLVLPVVALVLVVLLPSPWTVGLAILATVQPIAEWVWTHRARLTIHDDGVRWDAPWRHFDLDWDEIEDWRLRSIGFGRNSRVHTEWMLTVDRRDGAAVRAFVWRTAAELVAVGPAIRDLAPRRLGQPDGWPVSPASDSGT